VCVCVCSFVCVVCVVRVCVHASACPHSNHRMRAGAVFGQALSVL